jgi:hypothetical protein
MATVGCLRCGVWYDPSKPHLCGLLADETARGLAARLDALERRVEQLEAGQSGVMQDVSRCPTLPDFGMSKGQAALADDGFSDEAPRPRFDRKANHRRYMREWRARQTALRRQQQGVRP